MKGLFRLLGWTFACLAILTITFFILWTHAPEFCANSVSKQLKVPVEIGDIDLSFNKIEIDHFEIANLPNSYLPKAFSAYSIVFYSPLTEYLKKSISISKIEIDSIYLGLEFDSPKGEKGNWSVLMNNLQSGEKPTDENKQKTLEIKELILTNIQVEVVYKSSGGTVKKFPIIPRIVLTNINTEKGFPSDQLMQSVLGQMLKSVFVEENLKNMFENVLEQPQNTLNKLLKPFGLF